ncbi:MAG: heparinase II/III family protein [Rikenellaceae bacterium]
MNFKKSILLGLAMLLAVPFCALADDFNTPRPRLLLSSDGVKNIKEVRGSLPVFDASIDEIQASADNALASDIVVPQPLDGGGGYSHEQHKQNYYNMYHCGIMYQLTGDTKYAKYVKDMLYEYAGMYADLPIHPDKHSSTPGRLFWQTLNEYVWLVHTASAYDCIYEYLTAAEVKDLETKVFYPMAEFLSVGNKPNNNTFNKMHNHATWATTAVGMIGYVMGDKNLVDQALYGSEKIKNNGAGFICQLDALFSPDGYFTEGPYYQRYSIWPFVVFSQVIDNNQPDLKIYEYRDGILRKATRTMIDLTYNRQIMMFNDALEKTLDAQEIVNAVDAAYKSDPSDKELLSIAADQKKFVVSDAGLITAKAIQAGEAKPYKYGSYLFRDGSDGSQGGIAMIREDKEDGMLIAFKATSHGMGHGHLDKFNFSLYDNGREVMPDYGAVRFLNVEPKDGGGYTAENGTYGKQTISHNTVVVDKTSHFGGNTTLSGKMSPHINFFGKDGQGDKKDVQIVSSGISEIYPGVEMNRVMALINTGEEEPLVIDIFRVNSDEKHTYDLPFYYKGHLISSNFPIERDLTTLSAFGEAHGYQHLWKKGEGSLPADQGSVAEFTWVLGNRFYSVNTVADQNTKFFQVMTGANDPEENLRTENAIIIREETASKTFVSTIEPHGMYDLIMEITADFTTNVENLEVVVDDAKHTVVVVTMVSGKVYTLCVQNEGSEKAEDVKNVANGSNGQVYTWTGDYALFTK